MQPIHGNILRGHLETMVLSVLEEGAAHGFQVLRRLQELGSGALQLREGSLYPALYRLERAGFVKGEWDKQRAESRGPRRRVYHITPKGKRQLDAGRVEWRHFVSIIGPIVGAPV
jgi:DNA-binding PadR family transcriptional regulator